MPPWRGIRGTVDTVCPERSETPMNDTPRTSVEDFRRWRDSYRDGLGSSPLDDVSRLQARLDLTHAHPAGLAQLFASGHAPLSALFRDSAPLRAAGYRLGHVLDDHMARQRTGGVSGLSLAVGIAVWKDGDAVHRAPVLLYPATVKRRPDGDGTDATIAVAGAAGLNRCFATFMRAHHVDLDEDKLLDASAYGEKGPRTSSVFEAISREASQVFPDLRIERSITLGCFMDSGSLFLQDDDRIIDSLSHGASGRPPLDALAGDPDATKTLQGGPLPQYSPFDVDPHGESEIADVDNAVRYAAVLASSDRSLFLDVGDGVDAAASAAAVASRCVAAGKTVLYVPCVSDRSRRFRHIMDSAGMGQLVLDLADDDADGLVDRQLIAAVGFHAGDSSERFDRLADELVGIRSRLTRYLGDLHGTGNRWGVSAYATIEHLAAIAALPGHPSTHVRLSRSSAEALAAHLDEWSGKLRHAGELGEYVVGPDDTPWFGATLTTESEAVTAYRRVDDLLRVILPQAREQIAAVVQSCGFPVPVTASEWDRQVKVLKNLRLVLNVFQPQVFERDVEAMIEATKSKQARRVEGSSMGFWERRRRTKEARSLLRAGAQIEDLHKALVIVSRQARQWRELVPHGGWPVLPAKLDEIITCSDALAANLTALDAVLSTTPSGGDLESTDFTLLEARLKTLHDDRHALDTLPGRCALEAEFKDAGLSELVTDLRSRHVSNDQVDGELRLSWWMTVFEDIVRSSAMISNQDGSALQSASERFQQVDAEHIRSIGPMLRDGALRRLRDLLFSHTQEANQLHTALAGGAHVPFARFRHDHPVLAGAAKPVLVATPPTLVATTPSEPVSDVVILDAASHAPSAELLSVVARSKQIVVLAHGETISSAALSSLTSMLPRVHVPARPTCRSSTLSAFLEEHGYGDVRHDPVAPTSQGTVRLHCVEATGAASPDTGLVESSQAEIDEVVRIIVDRASQSTALPHGYILAVVVLTRTFRAGLAAELRALASRRPALGTFLRHVRLVDIGDVAGARATDVVLSLCYAKTAHGRLIQQFGRLEDDGGDRLLLDSCALARRRLDITASFGVDDLDEDRLHQPGPRLLRGLLGWADKAGDYVEPDPLPSDEESDVLFCDLAQRLRSRGLEAAVGYGISRGTSIPLVVGTPENPHVLAVLTDNADFMGIQSTRERHRLMSDRLRSLGWSVMSVWSVSAFVNPDREVDRILACIGRTASPDAS